jgi:diguanylate cyclase (GGDEF)-like protein
MATIAFSAIVGAVLVVPAGIALFTSWLGFARSASTSASQASGKLLNQIVGPEVRTNRRLAIYDPASGLYNRWYLELRLQEEFLRCKRFDLSMAVICVRLRSVNLAALSQDSWGGVASEVAYSLGKGVRAVDITGSLGPGEFAICLVHCDRAGAEAAASRVLQQVRGHDAEVGIAVHPDDECDGKALIELAHARLSPVSVSGLGSVA